VSLASIKMLKVVVFAMIVTLATLSKSAAKLSVLRAIQARFQMCQAQVPA
jgi:hypothetical protein